MVGGIINDIPRFNCKIPLGTCPLKKINMVYGNTYVAVMRVGMSIVGRKFLVKRLLI